MLRGRRWRLEWREKIRHSKNPKEPLLGFCDYESRCIEISTKQEPKDLSETVIHEMLHAIYPDLDEYVITNGAKDLNDALWAAELITEK